jgi:outer membrane beta-barrel protein
MTRLALGLFVILGTLETVSAPALAQATDPAPASGTVGDPAGSMAPAPGTGETAGARKVAWEDIVVVPRKAFIKSGRVELAPFSAMSLNDVLIRHYGVGANLNYFLSDVFSIGVEGQYYIKERSDREGLIGLQYNRVATLNRYKYSGTVNLGYVPGYGKFTLFNRYIWHWDFFIAGGVGVIRTEIIPLDARNAVFQNLNITPTIAGGTRFFLNRWMTLSFAFRDYVFIDKFEPRDRDPAETVATVKDRATSKLVNNVMFSASLGFFLPTSFQYKTPR